MLKKLDEAGPLERKRGGSLRWQWPVCKAAAWLNNSLSRWLSSGICGGKDCLNMVQSKCYSKVLFSTARRFSIAQLLRCRLSLWASAVRCVFGAASTFWKVTCRITQPAMLVCHKVTSQNLIDSGPLFLFTKCFSSVIMIFWLQFLRWFHWLWNLPMLQ